MGIKQRREREKQEVRKGILTAAREIALREGWQAVTIRKVAERIEYSPSMIYEYFVSKEAILLELLCEGFLQLDVVLKTARGSCEDYEERIIRMAEAYWEFAMRNPELYQVMHGLNGVPLDGNEKNEKLVAAHSAFMTTVEALNDWSQFRGIDLPDVEDAVEIFRAFLHGLVSFKMENRIHGEEARVHRLIRRAVHDLLSAWSLAKQE